MNRRTWQRVVWKNHGEDHSLGYDVQGKWKACPVVPIQQRELSFAVWGLPRMAGTQMAVTGGNPLPG